MSFAKQVYDVVMTIPIGRVASYRFVARECGNQNLARQVGWALHKNPSFGIIPCHRVVFRDGRLSSAFAFGGENMQRSLLESEGVIFLPDGRVDMSKYSLDSLRI